MEDKKFKVEKGSGILSGIYLLLLSTGCVFFIFILANFSLSQFKWEYLFGALLLLLVVFLLIRMIDWNWRGFDEVIFKESEVSIRRRHYLLNHGGNYPYEKCQQFIYDSPSRSSRLIAIQPELIHLEYEGGRISFCQGWDDKELKILTKRLNKVLESRKSNLTSVAQ